MSEVLNKRPLYFNMAIDILSLVKTQIAMGETDEKILIDIADQLTAVWKDGRTFGQNEGSENEFKRVKALIRRFLWEFSELDTAKELIQWLDCYKPKPVKGN